MGGRLAEANAVRWQSCGRGWESALSCYKKTLFLCTCVRWGILLSLIKAIDGSQIDVSLEGILPVWDLFPQCILLVSMCSVGVPSAFFLPLTVSTCSVIIFPFSQQRTCDRSFSHYRQGSVLLLILKPPSSALIGGADDE